jgi:ATP-binding cassette, subfamily B (MDR/TAP), member 1
MTDAFSPLSSADEVVDAASTQALYFLILGIVSFICSWIQYWTWMVGGEKTSIEFRRRYFEAVIRQEIGWFDTINPNELAT